MPPSRSTSASVRFNPSPSAASASASTSTLGSTSRRARTTEPADVIVISSDEENDSEVIIISSDDEADTKDMTCIAKKLKKSTLSSPKTTCPIRGRRHHAAPASVAQRAVTVARILAGDFGEPKTWTFGVPEPNFMDMDKFVEDGRKDPFLQDLTEGEWARLKSIDSKVHGAHPDKNDRTVRYTHVERYPGGPVWFTIRRWDGRNFGIYFDLVDVATQKLFLPHRDLPDLFVQAEFLGGMAPLCTVEEAMRRSRGVKKLPGANDDERYIAPAGARTLFSRILPNGKKVPVADVYSPRYGQPAPLGPQPPMHSPFGP